MIVRRVFCLMVSAVMLTLATGQDGRPFNRPPFERRSLANLQPGELAAETYANVVLDVLKSIHDYYHFEQIPLDTLAGRSILALYRAAGKNPPDALVRDPGTFIKFHAGKDLREKLKLARMNLGESPKLEGERAVHVSLRGVFSSLDLFSNYLEVDTAIRSIAEDGAGIGMYLEDRPLGNSYFVRSVQPNSLAHKNEIRPGDEILKVEQQAIESGTSTLQVNARIALSARRRAGVGLTVRKLDGTTKELHLQSFNNMDSGELMVFGDNLDRETPIKGVRYLGDNDWSYWIDQSQRIAMIRLGTIMQRPVREMEIINQLMDNGLKGLILDLRECPSGIPEYTALLAGYFLEQNELIATLKYRNPSSNLNRDWNAGNEIRVKQGDSRRCLSIPMAVLIGPDTSGAAEMIAAALQDHQRAKIVGERSRGKSTIQKADFASDRNSGVLLSYRLTVGMFERPSGKPLNRGPSASLNEDWGVKPDLEVVLPAKVRRQVRAWWYEHDLRPEDSLQTTMMDDARNDPVMRAALHDLLK
ncbi:MAG TPA: S41 family peptidase [Gemmatales bacterium]|nr:S41 family peptidase [Gemmatales bacterium]